MVCKQARLIYKLQFLGLSKCEIYGNGLNAKLSAAVRMAVAECAAAWAWIYLDGCGDV